MRAFAIILTLFAAPASAAVIAEDFGDYYLPPCGPHYAFPSDAAPWLTNRAANVRPTACPKKDKAPWVKPVKKHKKEAPKHKRPENRLPPQK